jgi:hypothetical protein
MMFCCGGRGFRSRQDWDVITFVKETPRVPTPADRRPGQLWRPGTPPPAPIPSDTPAAPSRTAEPR